MHTIASNYAFQRVSIKIKKSIYIPLTHPKVFVTELVLVMNIAYFPEAVHVKLTNEGTEVPMLERTR